MPIAKRFRGLGGVRFNKTGIAVREVNGEKMGFLLDARNHHQRLAKIWTESHDMLPGSVAHVFNRSVVAIVSNGYIGFLETEVVPSQIVAEALLGLLLMANWDFEP